jgi:hypothetical protein
VILQSLLLIKVVRGRLSFRVLPPPRTVVILIPCSAFLRPLPFHSPSFAFLFPHYAQLSFSFPVMPFQFPPPAQFILMFCHHSLPIMHFQFPPPAQFILMFCHHSLPFSFLVQHLSFPPPRKAHSHVHPTHS